MVVRGTLRGTLRRMLTCHFAGAPNHCRADLSTRDGRQAELQKQWFKQASPQPAGQVRRCCTLPVAVRRPILRCQCSRERQL